ncbi:MAG: mandelate racemase/muconate lactonizing enzyme family protein [Xanthobacteraceae bacterium]
MKITQIDIRTVLIPRVMPKSFEIEGKWDLPAVIARVNTDAGIEGIGHAITLMPEHTGSLAVLMAELGELLVGMDPRRTEAISARMMYPANWIGPGGLLNIAACALDVAVWDIVGKDAGQPLWRLLGGHADRARVYESGGLISPDIDSLKRAAEANLRLGYRAMKMRPGTQRYARIPALVDYVREIREVIGPDIDLMLDINQTWQPSRAIRAGRALEELELFWIEDPVAMHDVDGQAAVAAALDMPVCAGEYHYGVAPLLRLLQARAVDILMVDLMRVGGITPFRKVAAMAEAFGVPVASHLIPEIFASLIAAVPNGLIVEGMPWSADLFEGAPVLENGELLLSERPGHGLSFNEGFISRNLAR